MWQPPKFWVEKKRTLSYMLWPISFLYTLLYKLRVVLSIPYTSSLPIICVGNASLGGAGKTPTVLALASFLKQNKITPVILSRGYGGSIKEPTLINPQHHHAAEVGDEPLLLARAAETWVSKNKKKGVKAIEARHAKQDNYCILMDDGFQNPSVYKDINILVIDGKKGFGNGSVFPAGPLREPLEWALNRAHAFVILGVLDKTLEPLLTSQQKPVFQASIIPACSQNISGKRYIAFCGLAYPDKFFDTLKENKVHLLQEVSFADHHLFSHQELEALKKEAQKQHAYLITSEKDWVRLKREERAHIIPFPITLKWRDEKILAKFLLKKLNEIL